MYTNNRFIFYEKQYYHELEMKQKIDLRLQSLIIFALTWLNITSYLIKDIDTQTNPIAYPMFVFFVILFFALVINSLRYSVFSFYGNVYEYLQTPKKFEEFYDENKKYYEEYYPDEHESLSDKRFNETIMGDLIKTTHANCDLNDARAGNGFESAKYLVWAALPFAIAFFIYINYNLDLKHPSKPLLIEEKTLQGIFKNESTSKVSASPTTASRHSQCKESCHASIEATYKSN